MTTMYDHVAEYGLLAFSIAILAVRTVLKKGVSSSFPALYDVLRSEKADLLLLVLLSVYAGMSVAEVNGGLGIEEEDERKAVIALLCASVAAIFWERTKRRDSPLSVASSSPTAASDVSGQSSRLSALEATVAELSAALAAMRQGTPAA